MRYLVLRDLSSNPLAGPFDGTFRPFPTALPQPISPPIPEITVVDLDRSDREDLLRDPTVTSIAPSMPMSLIRPVAETDAVGPAGVNWGVDAIRGASSRFTGAGTKVAVLDTGIDASHPAFAGVRIVQKDFTGEGDGDQVGHGTHCAGTILGRDVAGTRIGVARGADNLLVGKVLGANGGSSDALLAGIQWASDNGADVTSMSLGYDFPGFVAEHVAANWPVELATSAALEAYRANLRCFDSLMAMLRSREGMAPATGSVVVAASGNESRRDVDSTFEISASLPAASEGVVSVGALGQSAAGFVVAPFSNTNPRVCAPGVDIVSAKTGGGLTSMSGTSMACPHAAGVAALWWEMVRASGLPALASTVVARLQATATLTGFSPGVDLVDRGQGLVQAPT